MIAMQYSFQLPADYDMGIVERRVADKGHLFDQIAGLGLKAFLISTRGEPVTGAQANCYAPFYVWTNASAMADFLCGDKFATVSSAFGWPAVQPWTVLALQSQGVPQKARFASRSLQTLAQHTDLAALRYAEQRAVDAELERGALFAMSGLDPQHWRRVRFSLWAQLPTRADGSAESADVFQVLHVSSPERDALRNVADN